MTLIRGTLRPLETGDSDLTLGWRNKPSVRQAMFSTDPLDLAEHQVWVSRIVSSPDRFDYSIFEAEGTPLGIVGIIWQDRPDGRAEWSFHIGEDKASKGAGTSMLRLALFRFFDELAGRKLCAEVIEDNAPSLAVHNRLGFEREGIRKKHVMHAGRHKDVMEFGLLRTNWENQQHGE